jgi:hypothetical protein
MTATPATPLPPLPNIYEIDPAGPQDRACFDELREVLERHGALQRFGITLLHQHFDMAPDEVLVESVDAENRILTMRPVSAKPNKEAVETSWRLDDPTAQRRCEVQCIPDRDAQGNPYHGRVHYMTS